MAKKAPAFSICIPAHDPFPFLETALDSVVAQTFDDWEIVIVDDCSERAVEGQLRKRGDDIDGKIKCIRLSENNGPFYARRVAFGASSGTYVLCIDSDDELLGPNVLEELYSSIHRGITLPDMVLFNATTSKTRRNRWIDYGSLGLRDGFLSREVMVRRFLETYQLNNLCLKAIKSELLQPARRDGAKGLYMCEDRLEVAGTLATASSFLLIDKPLYYYRQNPKSTTHRTFDIDFCRQQSFVEKSVADLFSAEFPLSGLYRMTMLLWADDMCRITQGRSLGEAADCFKVMANNAFYEEAYRAVGVSGQRVDRRFLLKLLSEGRYAPAAIAANIFRVLIGLAKSFAR